MPQHSEHITIAMAQEGGRYQRTMGSLWPPKAVCNGLLLVSYPCRVYCRFSCPPPFVWGSIDRRIGFGSRPLAGTFAGPNVCRSLRWVEIPGMRAALLASTLSLAHSQTWGKPLRFRADGTFKAVEGASLWQRQAFSRRLLCDQHSKKSLAPAKRLVMFLHAGDPHPYRSPLPRAHFTHTRAQYPTRTLRATSSARTFQRRSRRTPAATPTQRRFGAS